MACLTCRTEFEPRRRDHVFCSAKCRLRAFEAKREARHQDRHAQVRILLREALDVLREGES